MTLPSAFYVSDENRNRSVIKTVKRLPLGTGVLFRHYGIENRQKLGKTIASVCKQRKLPLLVAGDAALAHRLKADGLHLAEWQINKLPLLRCRYPLLQISIACHTYKSLKTAEKLGADLAFLSPLYPTKSHPGARSLTPLKASNWIKNLSIPTYALGGVSEKHFTQLSNAGFSGIAGISLFEADKGQ
jgi:thiamine-phosphate pyrophosphorylase